MLASCGGQGSFSGQPNGTYVVNVTVSGLSNLNNNNLNLQIGSNGYRLNFTSDATKSFPYQNLGTLPHVSVITPPSPIVCRVGPEVNAGANVINVAVKCSLQYVYVTNTGNTGSLSVWELEVDGSLRQASVATSLHNPTSAVVNPNPMIPFVYVASAADQRIYSFQVSNGVLSNMTFVNCASSPNAPLYLSASANGSLLFCASRSGLVSVYDISGGSAAQLPSPSTNLGTAITGIAVDPLGQFLYVINGTTFNTSSINSYAVDTNWALTLKDSYTSTTSTQVSSPTSVAINTSGNNLFVVNSGSGNVLSFNLVAGTLHNLPNNISALNNPHAITLTGDGTTAYVSVYGQQNSATNILQLGINNGVLSNSNSVTSVHSGPFALAVDATNFGLFVTGFPYPFGVASDSTLTEYSTPNLTPVTVGSKTYSSGLIDVPISVTVY